MKGGFRYGTRSKKRSKSVSKNKLYKSNTKKLLAGKLKKLKKKVSYSDVLKSIKKRDKSDYNRQISPLKKTKDSILINTSNLSKRACFLKIKKIIDSKINN